MWKPICILLLLACPVSAQLRVRNHDLGLITRTKGTIALADGSWFQGLGIGTSGQILTVSAGGTAEWSSSSAVLPSDFTQDGGFLVGTGAGAYQEEAGATARTSIGLGTGDTATFLSLIVKKDATDYLTIDPSTGVNCEFLPASMYLEFKTNHSADYGSVFRAYSDPANNWANIGATSGYAFVGFKALAGGLGLRVDSSGHTYLLADNQRLGLGAGGVADSYFQFDGTDLDIYSSGDLTIDASRVGIGTATPGSLLHVLDGGFRVQHSTYGLVEMDFDAVRSFLLEVGSVSDYVMKLDNASTGDFDIKLTDGDIHISADSKQLTLGAADATDSYLQWDGSELDIYSAGDVEFGSSTLSTTGGITSGGSIDLSANSQVIISSGSAGTQSQWGMYESNGDAITEVGGSYHIGLDDDNDESGQAFTIGNNGGAVVMSVSETGRIEEEGTFASIYVHDSSAAVTVATGAAYVLMTQFTTDGESANCTPAAASDKITITQTGRYLVTGSVSFTCDTNNTTILGAVFLNGVEQDQVHFRRKVGTSGDEGAAGITGIVDVTTGSWDLDFRMRHDQGGDVDITITYANLAVIYLGET